MKIRLQVMMMGLKSSRYPQSTSYHGSRSVPRQASFLPARGMSNNHGHGGCCDDVRGKAESCVRADNFQASLPGKTEKLCSWALGRMAYSQISEQPAQPRVAPMKAQRKPAVAKSPLEEKGSITCARLRRNEVSTPIEENLRAFAKASFFPLVV